MKPKIGLLFLLLCCSVSLAVEAPAGDIPSVLAAAPADATAIVYLADPDELLSGPLSVLAEIAGPEELGDVLTALRESFDGPLMAAVSLPGTPAGFYFQFAAGIEGDRDAFLSRFEESWEWAGAEVRELSVPEIRLLMLHVPQPLMLYVGSKAGVVRGSTRRADIEAWIGGEDLSPRFPETADAATFGTSAMAADVFVYVNTRMLMPLARMPLSQYVPGLYESANLGRLEFAALAADAEEFDYRLTLGHAADAGGVFDLLAPVNRPIPTTTPLPAKYYSSARAAMPSVAHTIRTLNEILAGLDADIVAEFDRGCASFRKDVGFHPVDDFLANLVDEVVVGALVDEDDRTVTVTVFKLADEAVFREQLEALRRYFELPIDETACGSGTVQSAAAGSGVALSWGVWDGRLIAASTPEQVCEVMSHLQEHGESEISATARNAMASLADEAALWAVSDLSQLAHLMLENAEDRGSSLGVLNMLDALANSKSAFGVAITRCDRAVVIRGRAIGSVANTLRDVTVAGLSETLNENRFRAKRIESSSNVREILMAAIGYANKHEGALPPDLATMLREGLIQPEVLRSPFDDSTVAITAENAAAESSYIYRTGTVMAPEEAVICERQLLGPDNGAVFGFCDGHTDWITGARAVELHGQIAGEE